MRLSEDGVRGIVGYRTKKENKKESRLVVWIGFFTYCIYVMFGNFDFEFCNESLLAVHGSVFYVE